MCKWIDEESNWCRRQTYLEDGMDIEKALEVAEHLENEGVISTVALALRALAKEVVALRYKNELLEKRDV